MKEEKKWYFEKKWIFFFILVALSPILQKVIDGEEIFNFDVITDFFEEGEYVEEEFYNKEHYNNYDNALEKALSYLDTSIPFSFKGLVEQLEYEGFSSDASLYAVEQCDVDWDSNAIHAVYDYLDYSPYSYQFLLNYLEFDGFTNEQALNALEYCDIDFKVQAAKAVEEYLKEHNYSQEEMIEELEYDGYTREEISFAMENVYL